MTTSDPAPVVALPAAPVTSLAELRSRHSALLQRLIDPQTRPSSGEILGFLEAASALGRVIDDENFSEREAAQSIMDYWVATLISQAPQVTEGTRPFSLADYDPAGGGTLLKDSQRMDALVSKAVKEGEALTKKLSHSEQKLLERLLLRFVRLKERSLAPILVPLLDTDDILSEPGVRPLLEKLDQTALLDHRQGEPDSPSSWVLLHEDLLVKWDFLRQTVTGRKAFRELANGWSKTGRNEGTLLAKGPQLDQASLYRDCNATEEAFRAASNDQVLNHEKSKTRITRIALAASVVVTAFLVYHLINTNRLNDELRTAQKKSDALLKDFTEEKKKTDDLNQHLVLEQAEVTKLNTDLTGKNARVEELNRELIAKQEELNKNIANLISANAALLTAKEEAEHRAATAQARAEERDLLLAQIADLRQQVQRLSAVAIPQTSAQIVTSIKKISADIDKTTKDSTAKIAAPDERTLIGPIKTFGRDGARPDEGLALIRTWAEADKFRPKLFLPDAQRTGTPLLIHLNPEALYVAARWDYSVTSRRWLISHKVRVKNPANGIEREAQPVDWGPGVTSKYVMDLSPGLARALGLAVNQEAVLTIPPIDPVPAAPATPAPTADPLRSRGAPRP